MMDNDTRYPTGENRPPRNQRLEGSAYSEPGMLTFLTIRAYKDTVPFVKPSLNHVVLKALIEVRLRLNALVLVYCLMPNHLHLLVTPRRRGASVLQFVDQFKGRATHDSWGVGELGKLWQPRSYDHVLRMEEEFAAVALYILENPVRAGLVENPREYAWGGGLDVWEGWHVGLAYAEWDERNQPAGPKPQRPQTPV